MKSQTCKFCFLLLTIVAIAPSNVIAQRPTPEKGDNLITIVNNKLASENYTDFGMFLVEQGFTFKSKDKDFLTLTTDEKTIGNGGYKYTLSISFRDSLISIRLLRLKFLH